MTLNAPRTANDLYGIVPRGAITARVTPFDLQIRTLAEYDANYLRDQIRSDLFINGHPAGIYAVAVVDDAFADLGREGLEEAIRRLGPDLERMLIEEFIGHGYRRRVKVLEDELKALRDHVNRPRWFHFHPVRRVWADIQQRWADLRTGVASVIAPKGEAQ